MPAKSVAQRKFMGMVRATQKGEMDNPSPELQRAAKDMGAKAVNKFAKTKEKNLPQKIGEEKKKNCGCGKDPCITYGPKKNAHKMPDGTVMPGKEHNESYGVGGSLQFSGTPGGSSHSNTRVGSINKKDKKKKTKEVEEGYKGTADLSHIQTPEQKKAADERLKKANKKSYRSVKEEIAAVVEARYEAGASTYGKASIRNKRAFGYGGNAKPPEERSAAKTRRTDEHKARRNVKKGNKYGSPDRYKPTVDGAPSDEYKKNRYVTKEEMDAILHEIAYTGPNKDERKVIKKMDNKKYAAKLADYEKNMDPKKRQALKDKATKGMKFVHEDAPTNGTGSGADGAGFSSDADENGPTAGMDQPLGGTMKKMKGHGGLTKKKAKCKKSPDGINKICESTEARYLSFLVQMEDVEFIFQGKSPADVKIRLRKIYRPEKLKGVKITRMLPAQVLHYYWEKRQASM